MKRLYSERNHFTSLRGLAEAEVGHYRVAHGNALRLETAADRALVVAWLEAFALRVANECRWAYERAAAQGMREAEALLRDPQVEDRRRERRRQRAERTARIRQRNQQEAEAKVRELRGRLHVQPWMSRG